MHASWSISFIGPGLFRGDPRGAAGNGLHHPTGGNVHVIKGVAPEVDLEVVFKGILPFFLAMVACVVILILFPQIALLLPGLR